MKKSNIRIFINIIMTIAFICLMNTNITGLLFHKILGMIISLIIVVHLFVNFKDIKKFTLKLFDKNFKINTKIAYACNIILGIFLLCTIFTGKLISIPNVENIRSFTILHKVSAVFTFIGISIHIGLHYHKIMRGFKSMLKVKGTSKVRTITLRILLILVIFLGMGHGQTSKIEMIMQYVSKMAIFASIPYYICEMNRKRKLKR